MVVNFNSIMFYVQVFKIVFQMFTKKFQLVLIILYILNKITSASNYLEKTRM